MSGSRAARGADREHARGEAAPLPLPEPPGRAAVDEQIEERPRLERLRAQDPGPPPDPRGEELEGDDRVDRRLPDHRLSAVQPKLEAERGGSRGPAPPPSEGIVSPVGLGT